ncbi:condensation domain-containing protein, partial [Pantoea sp. Ap-967]|uniref:condensation domain-containing protein n=1 Tax=Pantoea sp. Ap-967 TaxID=2608362 RepID=UPI00351ADB89
MAYVVGEATVEALKAQLSRSLPEYMVPAQWLFLDALPLSPNGKLDRRQLPSPQAQAQKAYVAPEGELEQAIAAIWQDVLRRERIGVIDNFFELGGDSIISIQVVSRARQAGIHFTPKALFQHQTVRALARAARTGHETVQVDQGPVVGLVRMTPIQARFFETCAVDRHHFNQSLLLEVPGSYSGNELEAALNVVYGHHDGLRLRFEQRAQGWQAHTVAVDTTAGLFTQVTATDLDDLTAKADEVQASLDPASGPLFRAVLYQLPEGRRLLLLVAHHLVIDSVSWRILLEDLQHVCLQLQQREPVALAAKTCSLQAWTNALHAQAQGPTLLTQQAYWLEQLQGVSPLPCDHPQGGRANRLGRTVHTRLDKDMTRRLLQEAPAAYRTQVNDLLLTALVRVLSAWTGEPSIGLLLEGHGREDTLFQDMDLSRTVGWFTSLFPLRLTPEQAIGASIKRIKEQLRAVPDKGLGFGMLYHLADDSALRGQALPQVVFNYLGQVNAAGDGGQGLVPVGHARGAEVSPEALMEHELSLNGLVYEGQFTLGWRFSSERFDEATIQALADAYAQELTALVEYCAQPSHQGVTPSDFPLAQLDQAQLDTIATQPAAVQAIYPLSPMQQGMLFHGLGDDKREDYLNQMCVDVHHLDTQRFEQAWQQVTAHHDILRTRFAWQGGLAHPMQIVERAVQVPFRVLDWRHLDEAQAQLRRLEDEELAAGFDLQVAPAFRLTLVRLGDALHRLIFTHHHILMDGWSLSALVAQVLQCYNGQALPANTGSYGDYIGWLGQQDAIAAQAFWQQQLVGLQAPTRLIVAATEGAQASGELHVALDEGATERLVQFARDMKVTVNTVLQAAWLLLLQRHSGQDTVAFGATVAGRPADLAGIEQQLGLFINTLPVIATPRADQGLADFLGALQAQNLALREFEHTPLFDIQRWAQLAGQPLFDSLLVFENYPVADALRQGEGMRTRFGEVHNREQGHYPLALVVALGRTLTLHWRHGGEYHAAFVQALASQFMQVLARMVECSGKQSVGELLAPEQALRETLLERFNATATPYDLNQTVHGLFEQRVQATPDAPALLFGEQQL